MLRLYNLILRIIFLSETDFANPEQLDESTSSLKSSGGSGNLRNLVTIKPVDIPSSESKPVPSSSSSGGIPIETVDTKSQKGVLDSKSPRSALRYIGMFTVKINFFTLNKKNLG